MSMKSESVSCILTRQEPLNIQNSPGCDSAQFLYLGVANQRNIEHTEGRKKGKEAYMRLL